MSSAKSNSVVYVKEKRKVPPQSTSSEDKDQQASSSSAAASSAASPPNKKGKHVSSLDKEEEQGWEEEEEEEEEDDSIAGVQFKNFYPMEDNNMRIVSGKVGVFVAAVYVKRLKSKFFKTLIECAKNEAGLNKKPGTESNPSQKEKVLVLRLEDDVFSSAECMYDFFDFFFFGDNNPARWLKDPQRDMHIADRLDMLDNRNGEFLVERFRQTGADSLPPLEQIALEKRYYMEEVVKRGSNRLLLKQPKDITSIPPECYPHWLLEIKRMVERKELMKKFLKTRNDAYCSSETRVRASDYHENEEVLLDEIRLSMELDLKGNNLPPPPPPAKKDEMDIDLTDE
jgi:hypothetical protein